MSVFKLLQNIWQYPHKSMTFKDNHRLSKCFFFFASPTWQKTKCLGLWKDVFRQHSKFSFSSWLTSLFCAFQLQLVTVTLLIKRRSLSYTTIEVRSVIGTVSHIWIHTSFSKTGTGICSPPKTWLWPYWKDKTTLKHWFVYSFLTINRKITQFDKPNPVVLLTISKHGPNIAQGDQYSADIQKKV